MRLSKPVRGFQVNSILDRLAVDVLGVLELCLSEAPLDHDRLQLALLATLSRRRYVVNLLYRDFRRDGESAVQRYDLPDGTSIQIHDQAIVYLDKVLARRPKLARRLRETPGNMHLLLGLLARHSARGGGWADVEVRRDPDLEARGEDPDFLEPLARALAAQRQRLGDDYGEDSARRRREHGPIWLVRGACAAELPEEMSLFEVLEATPVPLQADFADDPELQRMLARVMDSLNERYMLLRASGLDPDEWHDRDEPSIARLRELKQLRRPAEDLLRLQIETDVDAAYRRTFDELKGAAASLGGFASFDDFATSPVGQAILRHGVLSLDEPVAGGDEDDERARHETIASEAPPVDAAVAERHDAGAWTRRLLAAHPGWFDPVMAAFFTAVIGHGRPIHGADGEAGLLDDLAFRRLVRAEPSLRDLTPGELAEELYERAQAIIRRGLEEASLSRT